MELSRVAFNADYTAIPPRLNWKSEVLKALTGDDKQQFVPEDVPLQISLKNTDTRVKVGPKTLAIAMETPSLIQGDLDAYLIELYQTIGQVAERDQFKTWEMQFLFLAKVDCSFQALNDMIRDKLFTKSLSLLNSITDLSIGFDVPCEMAERAFLRIGPINPKQLSEQYFKTIGTKRNFPDVSLALEVYLYHEKKVQMSHSQLGELFKSGLNFAVTSANEVDKTILT